MRGMFLQKLYQFTVFVSQITIHSGTCWAYFHASRGKIFLQPVITNGAFIGNFLDRMNKPAAVRACLNTISATDAILFVYKNNSLRTQKSCTYRAYLFTWRFCTMITHLGNKKGFKYILIRDPLLKTIDPSIWGNYIY